MSEQLPPVSALAPAGDKKGLAITSLVLGILSLCASVLWYFGGPISIVGIVLGLLGMKSSGKRMAIAGIILSAIGLLLLIVFVIISLVSGPIIQQIQSQLISNTGY
jgi:hypothetical protein